LWRFAVRGIAMCVLARRAILIALVRRRPGVALCMRLPFVHGPQGLFSGNKKTGQAVIGLPVLFSDARNRMLRKLCKMGFPEENFYALLPL